MPFKSEKQRRYLWANEPEIARDWTDTYGSKIKKADGGIARIGLYNGGNPHAGGYKSKSSKSVGKTTGPSQSHSPHTTHGGSGVGEGPPEPPYVMKGGDKHYQGSPTYNQEIKKSQDIVKESQKPIKEKYKLIYRFNFYR